MKILYIIYRFYPSIGGSQNHVLALSKEMVKLGHEVTVVTTNSLTNIDTRGFSTGRSFSFSSKQQKLAHQEIYHNIKIIRFTPLFQIWTYLLYPQLFFYLLRNTDNFDIVNAYCYQTSEPDVLNLVSLLKRTPFILTACDIVNTVGGLGGFVKRVYDKILGKMLLNRAKFFVALTEENEKEYLELGDYKNKIEIIPSGVDYYKIAEPKINKEKSAKYQILFVGRLIEYKGAQYIIESIPEIIKHIQDIKFIFIGEDYGYKKSLLELSRRLKVDQYCLFTGKVSEKDLISYYRTSDIFVFPSSGEGFGLVALEAICGGAYPVLARSGGLIHILENIGGIPIDLNKNIIQQISNSVVDILVNLQTKKGEIKNMQECIKNNYSWPAIAKKTENVYRQIK